MQVHISCSTHCVPSVSTGRPPYAHPHADTSGEMCPRGAASEPRVTQTPQHCRAWPLQQDHQSSPLCRHFVPVRPPLLFHSNTDRTVSLADSQRAMSPLSRMYPPNRPLHWSTLCSARDSPLSPLSDSTDWIPPSTPVQSRQRRHPMSLCWQPMSLMSQPSNKMIH